MSPLMAVHPSFLLCVEAATRFATPVEAVLSMLEIVKLVREDDGADFALDGVSMHQRNVSPDEPRTPEARGLTVRTSMRLRLLPTATVLKFWDFISNIINFWCFISNLIRLWNCISNRNSFLNFLSNFINKYIIDLLNLNVDCFCFGFSKKNFEFSS